MNNNKENKKTAKKSKMKIKGEEINMKNKYEEKNSKMEYKEKEKAQDLKQELKNRPRGSRDRCRCLHSRG